MTRYDRQIAVLPDTSQSQQKLAAARILVVGAGGLASPVLQYLVGAGVGHIRLVDGDVVSLSNMHRQTIYRDGDIGRSKAERAASHMAALNPDCQIIPIPDYLTPDKIAEQAAGVDLVLDCADSFAVSYSLSDYCRGRLPLVSASVVGLSGYCGGFCGHAPSLRAVFPDLPRRFGSCADDGVLGPVVGIIGGLQAQMALAILTGLDPSPLGQLVTYDASANRFGGFRFDTADDPETGPRFIGKSDITADDFVIDLRHENEGPLVTAAARRIAPADITPAVPIANAARVVLCCQSGQRAWVAAETMSNFWSGPIALLALGTAEIN
jgi:molybdopterin/thiamine biosynthesis adenylyltransferase